MSGIKLSRRRTLLFATLTIVTGIITISACSSEDNPPAGSLAVAVAPTSINVAPGGGTGSATATITRSGSFTGAVTLTQSGAPAGVAITFAPAVVPGNSTASTVNVTVGAVVPGTHTITISAEGDNVTTATATLTVVVVGAEAGAISLAASPTTLAVAAGAAAVTSTITITRTAPFAGAVGLTVSGAPAGVTATMNPVSATGATSTLSVSATASAVNGTYPLIVRGAGTGIADATVTVNATVSGGASAGASFTFSPNPLPLTAGGASATSTVTIARTGSFAPSGALNLVRALRGTGGTMATVAPSSNVTGTTATVTAQASGAVVAGTYDLTLTGTGTGIPNAVGTLPVVVTGGGGGGNATFTWCTEEAPIWVASQDGSGAWTQRTPTSGSTYQFTFASGKGGVAFVQAVTGGGTDLTVIYGTLAEFNGAAGGYGSAGCGTKTVNGSVASVGATQSATVSLGSSSTSVTTVSTGFPNFILNDVPDGSLDLVATRTTLGAFSPDQIILRRGLNQADNSTLAPLDFGTQGFAPSTGYDVSVSGLGADQAIITSSFLGNGTTSGGLGTILNYTSGTVPYNSVPLAQLTAPDLQQLLALAVDASNTNAARFAGVYFHTPSDKTIAMGPALSTPTVTRFATVPYAQPRVQLLGQAAYNKLLIASYDQTNRSASVAATAAYYGAAPATWDVTLPDLSGAAGWNNAWGLDATSIDWSVLAQGGTILQIAPPADGSTIQYAAVSSGTTPLAVRSGAGMVMQRRLLDVLKGATIGR